MKLACIQPEYPHYRSDFFNHLKNKVEKLDLYAYNSFEDTEKQGFNIDRSSIKHIKNIQIKGILLYNIFTLIFKKYDILLLMLNFTHLSTWILLITKIFHRKKIILWGQGISVKRYLQEEVHPDWKLKLMIALSDGVWVYMDKECEQWKKIFPNKKIIALHNTISGIENILSYNSQLSKEELKNKYSITQKTILIFCARFTNPYRRIDILLNTIKKLDAGKYGFIIIGEGSLKPDFSPYSNVYNFGAIYDNTVKRELFTIADIYFQPGWVGLSIVEAMAYGKPIFTMKRTEQTKQCVEYSYIKNGYNGLILDSEVNFSTIISNLDPAFLEELGNNAKTTASELTIENMANNAYSIC